MTTTTYPAKRKLFIEVSANKSEFIIDCPTPDDLKQGRKGAYNVTGPRFLIRRCRHSWQLRVDPQGADPAYYLTFKDSGEVRIKKEE